MKPLTREWIQKWVTRGQAKDAVARCREIRKLIRQSMGLRK